MVKFTDKDVKKNVAGMNDFLKKVRVPSEKQDMIAYSYMKKGQYDPDPVEEKRLKALFEPKPAKKEA